MDGTGYALASGMTNTAAYAEPTFTLYLSEVLEDDHGEPCIIGGSYREFVSMHEAIAAASCLSTPHPVDLVHVGSSFGVHFVKWVSVNWDPEQRPMDLRRLLRKAGF
jgi:hypothetical protein